MFNWNDIRVFLTVAEEGSSLAAASIIGMNHTTVARRIDALEHALNLELFERTNRGYNLTAQGLVLLDVAKTMRASAASVLTTAEQLARDDDGVIRFAGNAEAMQRFGVKLTSKFKEKNPQISFDLLIDVAWDKNQSPLESGKADLVLRPIDEISGDTLIAKKLARFPLGVYCSKAYHQKYGAPRSLDEAQGRKFVIYSDEVARVMKAVDWLNHQLDAADILYQVNAVTSMAAALQSGAGLGLLPCVTGDATPDLVSCFRHEELQHTLWLVASKESYTRPAVRKFMAFAGEHFKSGNRAGA
ncbi:DNA-binding transcriptional LysR family regulator [Litoreibacter meonggei]|uniref:DNA-binding transcriptional LysR family regulator n=1 Tax=Litoreibacter meonggei TaxID=1049199 RepID=A0A497X3E7_9RHOB|nr:LysR family transcriptional regulator [Litoreibacter meonggei]RLJ59489.1 DNA-binding transcriptional LysR family regulator [Litoreibacter meonggei]